MPWREMSIINQREEFVRSAMEDGANRRRLCFRFGISPSTGYKWLARWNAGDTALADRSSRPLRSPSRIDAALEQHLLHVCDDHPDWGARAVKQYLVGVEEWSSPAISTVYEVLRRNGRLARSTDQTAIVEQCAMETPNPTCQVGLKGAGRVISIPPHPDHRAQTRLVAFDWMRALLQKEMSLDTLHRELGDIPGLIVLLKRLSSGRLSDRNRSMAVVAGRRCLPADAICYFLGIHRTTYRKYLREFDDGGVASLFARKARKGRKFDDEAVKQAVFSVLHEPPSSYGINRTSWIIPDLSRVLRETGRPACPEVIRRIINAAGYRWRKARIVLTSQDPQYAEKLGYIRSILSTLRPDEAFFSIDEFGPFAVKMKPGRALCAPGEQRVVPQRQKSQGSLIVTAALELSGNQVTHFYSLKKNTSEMVRLMELLAETYPNRRKLYLSWDAASWHMSERLYQRIEQHNASVVSSNGPKIEAVPLPSGAQFLNVIESVFSGMARAIIHSSDYRTVDEAKSAIDRHFAERNAYFLLHPKKAGRKIWGKEREPADFSVANNCKDPRYR